VGAGDKDDPALVAKQGFEALMKGAKRVVGGGLKTKAMAAAGKVTPDSMKAAQHRKMAEPDRRPDHEMDRRRPSGRRRSCCQGFRTTLMQPSCLCLKIS